MIDPVSMDLIRMTALQGAADLERMEGPYLACMRSTSSCTISLVRLRLRSSPWESERPCLSGLA